MPNSTDKSVCLVIVMTPVTLEDAQRDLDCSEVSRLVDAMRDIVAYPDHAVRAELHGKIQFTFFSPTEPCSYREQYDFGCFANQFVQKPLSSFLEIRYSPAEDDEQDTRLPALMFHAENLVLAATIAKADGIHFLSICKSDGKELRRLKSWRYDIGYPCEGILKDGWPTILDLQTTGVVNWMYSLPGFRLGFPKGPVGRALSAFSRVLADQQDVSFVWALVGLEALFGRDGGSKSSQILAKSEALLGPRGQKTRKLGKAYDFRSLFLHGSMDMPLVYTEWDNVPEYERYLNRVCDVSSLAVGVLLCCLQQLAATNRHELDFSFRVADLSAQREQRRN